MAVRLSPEMRALAHHLRYEPTPRRIRGDAGGRTIVDSQNVFSSLNREGGMGAVPRGTASGYGAQARR